MTDMENRLRFLVVSVVMMLLAMLFAAILFAYTCDWVLLSLTGLLFILMPLWGYYIGCSSEPVAKHERKAHNDLSPKREKRKPNEFEGVLVDDDEVERIIKRNKTNNGISYDKERLDEACDRLNKMKKGDV